ncbi:PaaI family thioesterase [Undibacterium arcticum]
MTSAIDPAASPSTSQPFPVDIPFLHDLGVEFLGMGNGEAQVALNLLPRHMNSWHVTHGGITMTLLDVAMSMAGRSLNPAAKAGVTVDMTTSFLQPGGRPGARIVAKGRAFHRSTTLCFFVKVRSGTASNWSRGRWAPSNMWGAWMSTRSYRRSPAPIELMLR